MSDAHLPAPDADRLIVERLGDEAIVFDPRTDEVHHLNADAAQAFARATDDVSRRNLLRGGLIVGGAAAVTSMLAPTAASAMCVPGSAGPLGAANGFNVFTQLSSNNPPANSLQNGQWSAFTSTAAFTAAGLSGSNTAMTWNGTNHFQSAAGSTLTPAGSGVTMTIAGVTATMGLVFTVPSSGYLFGTGAEVLTTNTVGNPNNTAGTNNIAWALFKIVGATWSQVVAPTTVVKNTTSGIQGSIDASAFPGLITVSGHKAIPVAAGDKLAIAVQFTDTAAEVANIILTWQ